MLEKIRQKLLDFVESDKDVPILAGFSVGFYMILFYYSKNFALANSWQQLLFFTAYYIAVPVLVFYAGYKILSVLKLQVYRRNMLFVGIISFFTFFFLQLNRIGFSKKIFFAGVIIIACLLSIRFKKYYKLFVLLLFLMAFFNVGPLLTIAEVAISASDEWKKQPDAIESIVFKKQPNIYYIQPDGYTNFSNIESNTYYNFDVSTFKGYLRDNGFVTYDNYRSNYPSTLLSNSATFSMKHHYITDDINSYAARDVIMRDNPVLHILKQNGYKTSFISENPYLVMNRVTPAYDFSNIKSSDIPFLKDGFGTVRDVAAELKKQIAVNSKTGNFYFVEKFTPGHIQVFATAGSNKEKERIRYRSNIQKANVWLEDIVNYITFNDPSAIIIIGADHGGFAGFEYTLQCYTKTNDAALIKSMFGAQLSIKWNDLQAKEYDANLKTGVNLFRTVFAFLAEDKSYLEHLQENSSYTELKKPKGYYRYISGDDKVVFEKIR